MPRKKKTPGRRLHGNGWQTFVKGNPGEKNITKTWPLETAETVMDEWLAQQKTLRDGRKASDASAGFAADVDRYFEKPEVLHMKSARPRGTSKGRSKRRQILDWWLERLGRDRPRSSITVDDVKRELYGLLAIGYTPDSVRQYKIALASFFNSMDPDGFNPCSRAKLPTAPEAAPRGRDMALVIRILDAMPDRHMGKVSRSKIRARVIAFTGLPPQLVREITAADLRPSAEAPTALVVHPRHKGAGADGRILELQPDGIEALRDFHAADCYGDFSAAGIGQAFNLAARKAGVTGIRLYDLRHSFCSAVYEATEDLDTVARLAVHAPGSKETRKYAAAAHAKVNKAAVAKLAAMLAAVRAASHAAATVAAEASVQAIGTKVAIESCQA